MDKIISTAKATGNRLSKFYRAPFSPNLFISVRGIVNLHIYLWTLKDLFWSLGYEISGSVFGCLAVAFAFWEFINAIKFKNTEEFYFLVPSMLWLFGNFWWMRCEFDNNGKYALQGREQGGYMLLTAYIFSMMYYIIFKWWPRGFIKNDPNVINQYEFLGFKPYFTFFENWRQYEFFQTVCWIAMETSWCFKCIYTWFPAAILATVVAIDFIVRSTTTKKNAMDFTHYISQLTWLIANIVWSTGELFEITSDDVPNSLFIQGNFTFRWLASVILALTFFPIILFYIVWIPLSYFGQIKEYDPEEDIGFPDGADTA